jgi:catechol 2,3-dioxygenase-like lactoylglutathione lyase family enzyme
VISKGLDEPQGRDHSGELAARGRKSAMQRSVDHLVLCVNDLDAACEAYRKLGFTVTPKAVHPFGTGNALVQLEGMYLELLAVLDPEKIEPDGLENPFSFAVYNRDFLRMHDGMSMLAFQSDNASIDREVYLKAGAASPDVFNFQRKGTDPDGNEVDLAFSLAFVNHPLLRHAVCFSCQHHHPAENFYFPLYQDHANTAIAIDRVYLTHWAAEVVEEYFTDIGAADLIEVMHQDELIEKFGLKNPRLPEDGFAGFHLLVEDIGAIRDAALSAGAVERNGELILPPSSNFGAMMVIGTKKAA